MTETSAADSPARSADKTSQHIPLSLSIEPGSITKLLDLFKEMLEATIAKTMAQMPVVHEAKPATQAVELPNSSQSGLDLKPSDKVKAADLRTALLLGKIPNDSGLLIDTKTLAKLLRISRRHLHRLQDLKAIPEPVRLGQVIRWRIAEILEWIEADCPVQEVWAQRRKQSTGRKGK